MFIAQVLVGPSKQMKQVTQIEHNIVKNPNWPEANQLAIYKCGQGFELGATDKQIQVVVREGSNPGLLDCEYETLATQPHCLLPFHSPPHEAWLSPILPGSHFPHQ